MNNKTVSSGNRITLSSDKSSLTISGVLRSDEEFTCSAYNMVNMNTSNPYRLNVQYGPENLTIYINPELPVYETGSNANFSCLAVSNPGPEILWYFNGSSLQHNGRHLILVNLSLSDTGIYACEAFNNVTKRSSSTTRNFVVLEPVSNVTVTSNATQLIEYNDTVSLTCFANGTDVSYLWLEENTPTTSGGRFELSADSTILTIAGVLRTDGCFTCRASNLINNLTSDRLCLDINYGPDRPNITTNTTAYIAGSTITLTCSADSRPAAILKWHFSGALRQTGKELVLDNISVNETGNYTCQAYNNITERFRASTRKITVLELISNVSVNISNSQPTENDTVLFTCAAKGTIQRRTWFKDDKLVQSEGRIITSPDNVSLTITGLLRNDTGKYKCNVSNGFSSDSAEIGLQVNYGPDNITIHPQGPVEKYTGDFLTLQCFADTVPSGEYTWYNGTNIVIKGQTYNITSVRKFDSGNYTCLVNNNITMKNNSLSVMVFIQDPVPTESPPGGSGGLSGGAIAGIVIGVIAGVVLVCGLAYCIIKTKTSRLNTGFGKSDPKGTSPENIPSSQTEYAEIERKKPSQPKPAPSSNGANAAPAQAKDEDVIYTRPNIINPGTKPTSEALVDNKTDYAEVKYR
ncbi:cell adhesion molecule CEACAM5 isoform X1 [Hemitrygon akajei]|uniref:cell adhesion molecule CEACAM5 isoform X1 n=1 Tax=Hemitrygon akajei TaxID=2704970 RepID=UPI003BF9BFB2